MIGPVIGVAALATGTLIGLRLFRDDIRLWRDGRKGRSR